MPLESGHPEPDRRCRTRVMTVLNETFQGIDLSDHPRLDRLRSARIFRLPVPVIATAVALVLLGQALAGMIAALGPLAVSTVGQALGVGIAVPEVPVAGVALLGAALGMPMAIHVLHQELASPLRTMRPGEAIAYAYTPRAHRRMTIGLAAAYVTAVVSAVMLIASTGSAPQLWAALTY